MGLFDRLLGGKKEARDPSPSTEFREDESTTELSPRNAPRHELVKVVLRDTMRKHGIPSNWIECRILSVVSASRGNGMHVQLVVRDGDERLLTYVHAFQDSFVRELERFEPKALDWLFSLSWQFEGKPVARNMPDPVTWGGAREGAAASAPPATAPSPADGAPAARDAELEEDLKALFAIRDAVLQETAQTNRQQPDFEPTRPGLPEEAQQSATKPRR